MANATYYNSTSKGPTLIAEMNFRHLENAKKTLLGQPHRSAELAAINERLIILDAEEAARVAAGGPEVTVSVDGPMTATVTEADPAPPPAARGSVMGDNDPPKPTRFEAYKTHLDDLRLEAGNWLDGTPVENQGQADEVSRLMAEFRKAGSDADAARKGEKEVHLRAGQAVDAKWKPLLTGAELAVDTCKKVLQPFLVAKDREQRAEAERLRLEAQAKSDAAAQAARTAPETDISAREEAEALFDDAAQAQADAKRAEAARPQAHGSDRATTLRTYYTPVLEDARAAAAHYWTVDRPACEAFFLSLAQKDVAAGRHTIPGFRIDEERRVV